MLTGARIPSSHHSFNPIENEAVVAEALKRCSGSLELVDVSGILPKFRRRPGMLTWKVMNKGTGPAGLTELKTTADIPVDDAMNLARMSMFPPPRAEAEAMHLERCMRCLPHDQDTGGFFICLLRKVAPIHEKVSEIQACEEQRMKAQARERKAKKHEAKAERRREYFASQAATAGASAEGGAAAQEQPSGAADAMAVDEEVAPQDDMMAVVAEPEGADDNGGAKRKLDDDVTSTSSQPAAKVHAAGDGAPQRVRKEGEVHQHKEEYLPLDPAIFARIQTQYGMDPSVQGADFFTRSETAKSVSMVCQAARQEFLDRRNTDLKLVHCGMKVFEKNDRGDSACPYRLQQEGVHLIIDKISKCKVALGPADFQLLVDNRGKLLPYTSKFSADAAKRLLQQPVGCIVCYLDPSLGASSAGQSAASLSTKASGLAVVCWRGNHCLNILMPKADGITMKGTMTMLGFYQRWLEVKSEVSTPYGVGSVLALNREQDRVTVKLPWGTLTTQRANLKAL